MINKAHWSLKQLRKLRSAIGKYSNPVVEAEMEMAGEIEGFDLSLVEVAIFFEPEPIGLAIIIQRAPYTNPEAIKQRLVDAVERGWLTAVADGAYKASEKGVRLYAQITKSLKDALDEVESLSESELGKIKTMLSEVVLAASNAPEVLHKPALAMALREKLDPSASTIQQIQLQVAQFLSYRDDAHMASWSPHQLEGITWETLSDVWEGKVTNAAEMVEKRPFRRYEQKDYVAAFEDLAVRGWLKEKDGAYVITEEGRRVREKAEEFTTEYYDAPWASLNEAQSEELNALLQKLLAALNTEKVPA